MKVKDVCIRDVRTCRPSASLVEAGSLFRSGDCGFLPVVDDDHRVVGVVTDRDLCLALTTRNVPAQGLQVGDVMTPHPLTCGLEEDLLHAMEAMARHQLRRLPVVDARRRIQGVLSLADVVRTARAQGIAQEGAPTFEDLAQLLRAVCSRRRRRRPDRRSTRLDPFMA